MNIYHEKEGVVKDRIRKKNPFRTHIYFTPTHFLAIKYLWFVSIVAWAPHNKRIKHNEIFVLMPSLIHNTHHHCWFSIKCAFPLISLLFHIRWQLCNRMSKHFKYFSPGCYWACLYTTKSNLPHSHWQAPMSWFLEWLIPGFHKEQNFHMFSTLDSAHQIFMSTTQSKQFLRALVVEMMCPVVLFFFND